MHDRTQTRDNAVRGQQPYRKPSTLQGTGREFAVRAAGQSQGIAMIRIKTVDKQNLLNVCKLTTIQDRMPMAAEGHLCCNAFFIAEAKYHPEMYPNAIYQNNVPIGFFLYQRTEQQPDTATICRFMLDDRFRKKEIETAAFAHILRGLKIQGVKKVIFLGLV